MSMVREGSGSVICLAPLEMRSSWQLLWWLALAFTVGPIGTSMNDRDVTIHSAREPRHDIGLTRF